jgi:DNA-binding CsgD family transcriptional regulator
MTPTPRDLQVLSLTATGLTRQQIGRHLYITEPTVKVHLAHAYERLGARNAPHAVALALTAGLIPAPRTPEDRL